MPPPALPTPQTQRAAQRDAGAGAGAEVADARPGPFRSLIPFARPRSEMVPRWEATFPGFLRSLSLAVRPGTATTYLEALSRFIRDLPDQDPLEATRGDVEAFLTRARRGRHGGEAARPHAASTIVTERAALRRYFGWARREGLVGDDPTEGVGAPRRHPYRDVRALSAEEASRLLGAIPTASLSGLRLWTLTLWWLVTGRRHHEVLWLRWGDLDLEGRTYTYEGKGGRSERRQLAPELVEATGRWATASGAARRPEELLFPGRWADQPVTPQLIRDQLQLVARQTGLGELPRPVHTLRHTSARLRRSLGASLEDVQLALDHSSLATTALYVRHLEGASDPFGSQLASLLSPAAPPASAVAAGPGEDVSGPPEQGST
jgi:integrase/recombinase XerC